MGCPPGGPSRAPIMHCSRSRDAAVTLAMRMEASTAVHEAIHLPGTAAYYDRAASSRKHEGHTPPAMCLHADARSQAKTQTSQRSPRWSRQTIIADQHRRSRSVGLSLVRSLAYDSVHPRRDARGDTRRCEGDAGKSQRLAVPAHATPRKQNTPCTVPSLVPRAITRAHAPVPCGSVSCVRRRRRIKECPCDAVERRSCSPRNSSCRDAPLHLG
ncbi:hypothetical protein FKP32DRAFT_876718 [Trametes sanguinea]|nr:hypothetical protein FKP32DRAFT_876718 [Trametes sanguinea]